MSSMTEPATREIRVFLLDDHEVVRRGVADLLGAEPDLTVVGEAGAAGYVLKQIRGSDLVGAVRTVASGQSLLDPRTTARVLDRMRSVAARQDPLAGLSEQERAVLDLIGEGLTNREIGERMFLAEKTVKNYVSHLLAKLGMQRRTQAAILATELRRTAQPTD